MNRIDLARHATGGPVFGRAVLALTASVGLWSAPAAFAADSIAGQVLVAGAPVANSTVTL